MSVVAQALSGGGADEGALASVDQLQIRHHLRADGLDESHVAALAELEGNWPPLLVWADHPNVVLDGAHRLAAARRLGHPTVRVVAFHGTADEAFVEAVRRNVGHGLPLSVADRTRAGQQILARHPDWSDRRIAEACALSPHTVARLRSSRPKPLTAAAPLAAVAASPAEGARKESAAVLERGTVVDIESRLGRDGRCRPAQPGMIRERVVEALRANPGGSLREIASVAKVSPETVRRIRREFDGAPATPVGVLPRVPPRPAGDWRDDPAMASSPELSELVEWLDRTEPGSELASYAGAVPLSRVYELADEGRRRAAFWTAFATALEARAHGRAYSLP
ncbi:MAG TPA: hypothetical protein VNF71_03700 [Acidimicrobiales bacterium]|nr:hypothetical protein [Acidimicrobiales bacterium]